MVYLKLFWVFFKVGLLGFGGGYAILPMIYQDVQAFDMMSADDFSNLVALSQVTPGPIAVNAATYVGFRTAGVAGSALATFAVSLPSFSLILLVLAFLDKFRSNVMVQRILAGIKPATVGLMFSAFLFMFRTAVLPNCDMETEADSFLGSVDWIAVAIFVLTYALIKSKRFGAITLTLFGGFLGVLLSLVVYK